MTEQEQALGSAVKHYRKLAVINYVVVFMMLFVAVAASAAATLIAATKTEVVSHVWLAIFAGTPAAILLFNNAFQFENKSLWHFEKRRRLEGLWRTLVAGSCDAKDAAQQWNLIDEEMDKKWPRFGAFPVTTTKPK